MTNTKEASLENEWHTTKNCSLKLSDFSESSAKRVWWQCAENPLHEWEARIFSRRKQGAGCPYCKGKKVLPEDSLHEKYADLLLEWDYGKNKLDPTSTHCRSSRKVWWKCKKGHEWKTMIIHRTKGKTCCPYCCNQKACDDNSILTTNSPILAEWHPTKNVDVNPSQLVKNSHKIVWWKCPVAEDHEWQASIYNRFKGYKKGFGCPCCLGRKTVPSNCLSTTHPEIAKEWHPTKNTLSPNDVTYASNKKAWFQCSNDSSHVWQCVIAPRALCGHGCPLCSSSKGEKNIKLHLDNLQIEYKREYRITECRHIRPLPFDFALLKNNNLLGLIEYQGRQHYTPNQYFGGIKGFKVVQRNDNIKQNYCKENNIKLLIIPFMESDIEQTINKFIGVI